MLWPPASTAVTVVPDVPLGTLKMHENAPELSVVIEPLEQTAIAWPSNNSDVSDADTENPAPETVTVAPTGPCPGATVIAGAVTVNVPVAV